MLVESKRDDARGPCIAYMLFLKEWKIEFKEIITQKS